MEIQGNIVDIERRRIFPGTVVIKGKKIAAIREENPFNSLTLPQKKFLPYILPGFIDSHLHLEMTHVLPSEYARTAMSMGVTGAVVDCHDIVHVAGRKGLLRLINSTQKIPFTFGFSAPSTIVPEVYTLSDVQKLLKLDQVTHLGEIQDYPDVILKDPYIQQLLRVAAEVHKPVDGCSPGVSGENLEEYCKSGISTDHQCISSDNVLEKIKHGMTLALGVGNSELITSCVPLFSEFGDSLMFCGQSLNAPAVGTNYINRAVSNVVRMGGDLFGVLRAACLTPVKHYNLGSGTLHVGDSADFIMVGSLEKFNVVAAFIEGECRYSMPKRRDEPLSALYKAKKFPLVDPGIKYPFTKHHINENQLQVSAVPLNQQSTAWELHPAVNVINICDGEMTTIRSVVYFDETNGRLESSVARDCLKLVLVDRTGRIKEPSVAFVHGFGITKGAAAMSISHDEHNIIAFGTSDRDIVCAVNRVVDCQGGIALAVDGKIRAELPLPVAGLMSNLPLYDANRKFYQLKTVFTKEMGCTLREPIYTLSYLASTQLPSLKLSLKGLVNVIEQEAMPLVQ